MDVSMILSSGWISGSVAILAASFGIWLIWKLHQIFFRWFQAFFSRNAYVDETVSLRLNRFAWCLAILFPAWILVCSLWARYLQNYKNICGVTLGSWVSIAYLICNFLFLLYAYGFLAFFVKCYQTQQNNLQRPIHPIVKFLYVILVVFGIILLAMAFAKERPLVFLSTLGGAAALFIFAFQNLISSIVSNFQVNAERMLKIGDWVAVRDKNVDGVVESIGTMTIRVRNWDRTLVSFPIRLLQNETLVSYQSMVEYGARRIERSLLIDQRSIRFLTGDEVAELKKLHLVTDEMLKKSDAFPETDDLAGEHCWTNVELFTLYAEDYLRRRPDIRHDIWCLVRAQNVTELGLELELFCFSTKTRLAEFAPVQRAILFHLLAVLPSFRLRVFQRSSDIFQEIGNVPDTVGSTFRYDRLKNPASPSDRP